MDASLWLVIFAVGTLLMRVASAMHLSGMVRSKNSAGAVMRCVADFALSALAFWLVGYAVFDTAQFRWRPADHLVSRLINWREVAFTPVLSDLSLGQSGTFIFLLAAVLISTSIVIGVAAERSRFFPMCLASLLMAGVVAPMAGSWLTTGWLRALDFRDFAWAGPIHLSGAAASVVIAVLVGPRTGKYNRDGSSNAIPGHSVSLALLGVLLALVSWFAYILGFLFFRQAHLPAPEASAAGLATNVLLASAAGAAVAMLVSQFRYHKPDLHLTNIGLLGALVAISAAPDVAYTWMAVLIGAVAGLLAPTATLIIDLVWKVDDPSSGIAVHGVGAVWGLLAAGIFISGTIAERARQLAVQVVGIAAIAALAAAVAGVAFYILRKAVTLRVKEADEYDGLDLAEHDINAYPDFQQTMIKSYHLREA